MGSRTTTRSRHGFRSRGENGPTSRIAAKLSAPRLPEAVPRERLFGWFDKHKKQPLIWIAGPPGSGKTALVASYLERYPCTVLWYRVDDGDVDLPTVFHNLREAARAVCGQSAEQLPLLTPEYLLDIPTFVRNFLRALFLLLGAPATVVVDNLQDASEGTLDVILRMGVAEAPHSVQLIAISRDEPSSTIAALQVKGMLAILDWADLRLTIEEAQAIACAEGFGDENFVRDQYGACDGWIAGFILLIQHAKHLNPATLSRSARTRSALLNYFSSELFSVAPPIAQHLLLRTALLPSFTLTQASIYAAREQAQEVIDWLLKHNFFIDSRSGAEPVYRYHDLFREFLLDRGHATLPPDERRTLLLAAARSAEQADQPETALALTIEAQAWDEANRLICWLAPGVLQQGRSSTLERWIDALPDGVVDETDWLWYWQGLARMPRDPADARRLLEQSYLKFEEQHDFHGLLRACAAILQSFFFEWGDSRPLDRWLAVFQSLLDTGREHIPVEVEQLILPCVMSVVLRWPNHELVRTCAQRSLQLLEQLTGPGQQITAAILPLHHFFATGQWAAGARLLQRLERNVDQSSISPLHRIQLSGYKVIWSAFCPALFSRSEGETEIKRSVELIESTGIRVVDTLSCGFGVYFALNRGNLALAEDLLRKLRAPHARRAPTYEGHRAALLAHVALARGNVATADSHVRLSMETSQSTGSTLGIIGTRVVLAQMHIVRENHAAALDEAEQIVAFSRDATLFGFWHGGLLLRAYTLLKMQREELGIETLREALALGRATDQSLIFPWALPAITSYLYAIALARGIETDYVCGLIRLLGIRPPSLEVAAWPWPLRIYTLGRFALVRNDEAVKMTGKAQKKPLQLLQALIALGGRSVSIDALVRQVWPRQGNDAGGTLHVALTRLRRLLGNAQAVILNSGKLTLDEQVCWVDAWAFERGVSRINKEARSANGCQGTLDLYRGPFLADDHELPCTGRMRERLSAKFQRVALLVGKQRELEGEFDHAADVYRRGLECDVCNEEFCRRLMYCEWKLGRRAAAIGHYRLCREFLGRQFRTKPSIETERMYQRVRND